MPNKNRNPLPLWRSQLIMPINVEKYVAKAHERGADSIVLDLEDSIPPSEKAFSRSLIEGVAQQVAAKGTDVLVRINRPLELAVRDIEAAVLPSVAGLVLPKVESASHVQLLAELVDTIEADRGLPNGHVKFIALIETADAFFRCREIARAHERVVAISLGSEDFSLATQSDPDPDVLLYPKQQIVIAAHAAGILPMGVIASIANYQDIDGYRAAIRRSKRFGFQGGSCIHPAIVPLLNDGFSPSADEVASAEGVIAGYEEAKKLGRASATVDGKMIDIPIVERAERILRASARIRSKVPGEGR